MIAGIGSDLVEIARMRDFHERHGDRALIKLLAPGEIAPCRSSADAGRFLAKRFAAKEALGKALGCGIRAPLVLPAIEITHDAAGRPGFSLREDADALLAGSGLVAHLSISDEADYALAFVVLEKP